MSFSPPLPLLPPSFSPRGRGSVSAAAVRAWASPRAVGPPEGPHGEKRSQLLGLRSLILPCDTYSKSRHAGTKKIQISSKHTPVGWLHTRVFPVQLSSLPDFIRVPLPAPTQKKRKNRSPRTGGGRGLRAPAAGGHHAPPVRNPFQLTCKRPRKAAVFETTALQHPPKKSQTCSGRILQWLETFAGGPRLPDPRPAPSAAGATGPTAWLRTQMNHNE